MREQVQQRIFFSIIFFSIFAIIFAGYSSNKLHADFSRSMISVAHRGASSMAPENTKASFEKGIELGADYLEFDVHMSKDNELIVIHDDSVDRTTNGAGYVRDLTLDEIKSLDAGHHFTSHSDSEEIMTLDELLESYYGQVGLLIEIKKPVLYPGIEEKVVEALLPYEDVSGIIIQSFNIDSMRKVHELLPDVEIALLMKATPFSPSFKTMEEWTTFATYINFNVKYVNRRTIDQIHQLDGKVLVWSNKDDKLLAKAKRFGADGIISNFSNGPFDEPLFLAQD